MTALFYHMSVSLMATDMHPTTKPITPIRHLPIPLISPHVWGKHGDVLGNCVLGLSGGGGRSPEAICPTYSLTYRRCIDVLGISYMSPIFRIFLFPFSGFHHVHMLTEIVFQWKGIFYWDNVIWAQKCPSITLLTSCCFFGSPFFLSPLPLPLSLSFSLSLLLYYWYLLYLLLDHFLITRPIRGINDKDVIHSDSETRYITH